ncbi:HAD-IA family hydrolase [Salinibacterium sp.]|uniref:HAD-IA family hydrolase n=1 Tax=Salinibacterium sp. TaxID=1915057 RepID=UPI00286A433B|nr:HAD-IA family hydrolase [Salinibacterium sp.]
MDLYFFDLDRTLYAYNFRCRLPELARLSGASQYQIASSWWAGQYEIRAEAGEWPTADAYLDEFARITGGRRLSLKEWASARAPSMSRIDASVEALRRAAELGTVCLLSNNPAPLGEALPLLAPDVVEIVGDNILVSYMLGIRKPEPELFARALDRFGASASSTFFADDSAENIAGARSVGITGYHLEYINGVPQTDTLLPAVEAFAGRDQ